MFTINKLKKVTETKIVPEQGTLAQYIGYQFEAAREAKGWEMKEVLIKLGTFSITHMRNIERGLTTLKLKDMEILCELYGMSVTSIFPVETEKIDVYYSLQNGGDGSAYPAWFLTSELAEEDQENMDEGWGEPCTGKVETYVGSNIHCKARDK